MIQYWIKFKERKTHVKTVTIEECRTMIVNTLVGYGWHLEEVLEVNIDTNAKRDVTKYFT